MNRIVIIIDPKTGDWLTKNDFTSVSEANNFIETNEAFNGYISHSMPTQGDWWTRQRQAIQVTAQRVVTELRQREADIAATIVAVQDTEVSQEANAEIEAELHRASSLNAVPDSDQGNGTAPELVLAEGDAMVEVQVNEGTAPEAPLTPLQKIQAAKQLAAETTATPEE